jgi:UDP-N-acetyl-D-mannosaminuronate dehydrogenase
MYTICMVGTGYVGLVTGACLADFGNRVICVDVDAQRIATLEPDGYRSSSRCSRTSCSATTKPAA